MRGRDVEERNVQSEYGGLVLGADGALGIFGVHDPGRTALTVSVHIQRFHLKEQGGRHVKSFEELSVPPQAII